MLFTILRKKNNSITLSILGLQTRTYYFQNKTNSIADDTG